MTIEEKAYNEAKKAYDKAKIRMKELLKKSEDDKIKEELTEYFRWNIHGQLLNNFSNKEVFAWLEKQGEPAEINPSEFDLRLNKLLKQFETLPKEELASCLSFYLNVVQNDGTYKREEKEGEQPRYSIGDVLCDKSCTTLNKDAQSNFEITDIRNGMYICDKCSFPISQQDEYILVAKKIEQKPAEWSEEDEKERKRVVGLLEGWLSTFKETCYAEDCKCGIEWLKSLKSKYQWKPTIRQLTALEYAVNDNTLSCDELYTLNELYEQLKKL